MITEQDLREAIAECEGQRNPGANTCIKLAAFYILKDHLFPEEQREAPTYSYASAPVNMDTIWADGDSEFQRSIDGRNWQDVLPVLEELMTALSVVNPRLYAGAMRKLND